MKLTRLLAAIAIGALAVPLAHAQDFPSKSITVVVPYTPGSTADVVAREMASRVSSQVGQSLIIKNAPGGAAGSIGTNEVIRAKPDGYTLLSHSETTITMADAISPDKEPMHLALEPVSTVVNGPFGLYVSPSFPAQTLMELVEYAKANPGKVKYGTAGPGSSGHIAGVILGDLAGIDIKPIAYQGGAPIVAATISGEIELALLPYGAVKSQVEAGTLKVLAMASKERDAELPDVPTAEEAGVPGYLIAFQIGVFAPKGTPAEIIDRLNKEVVAAVADPGFVETMKKLSYIPSSSTPNEFAASMAAEYKRYQDAAKSAGLIN